MRIDEFAKGVRGLIYGKPNEFSVRVVKKLNVGTWNFSYHVQRNSDIHVFNADLEGVFNVLSRIKMYVDYTYEAKVNENGEIKVVKVKYPINTPISEARRDIGNPITEKVSTEDFEIIKINKEIIIHSDKIDNYFRLLCGLFPYYEITDDVKDYKVEVQIEVFEKEPKINKIEKHGKVLVHIYVNGTRVAAKSAVFKIKEESDYDII